MCASERQGQGDIGGVKGKEVAEVLAEAGEDGFFCQSDFGVVAPEKEAEFEPGGGEDGDERGGGEVHDVEFIKIDDQGRARRK